MSNMKADKETRREKTIKTIVETCVILTLAFLTLLIFATFLNAHPLQTQEAPQKKLCIRTIEKQPNVYDLNIRASLQRQKDFGDPDLAYQTLEQMFNKIKKEIQPQPTYNKKEALNILSTIGSILKEEGNFECKSNMLLIEELNKGKNGTKFLDCDDYSSIYLAAAEQLGLSLEPVYFPAHVFLKCELNNNRDFYWEPTIAAETNISDYKKSLNIPENSRHPIILNEIQFEAIKLCDLGTAWFKKKNYTKAIEYFQKAIEANADFAPALNNLGAALAKEGKFSKAIKCYAEAIHLDPYYATAFTNMGVAYYKLGDCQQAIKYFEKSLKINPKNSRAARYKFRVLFEEGKPQKAYRYIAHFDRKRGKELIDFSNINK